MNDKMNDVMSKLAALKSAFASKLPAKVIEIESAIDDGLDAVQALAHKLAGSAGTHGFSNLGHTARNLELVCQAISESGKDVSDGDMSQIRELIALLHASAEAGADTLMSQPDVSVIEQPETVDVVREGDSRHIILVDDDAEQSAMLDQLLSNFGFSVRVLNHPSLLAGAITEQAPVAVVMDIVFDDDKDAGLTFVNALRNDGKLDCPVVFISVREDFRARLDAIRAGSDGYVVKPVNIIEMVDTLDRLIEASEKPPLRVLIVDDDPEITDYCKAVLEGGGLLTSVVNDPLVAVERMHAFNPDIIVLDIEMPNCDGFELASAIRQMGDRFLQVPILFLTGHSDMNNKMRAAQTGSEDFLSKPVDSNLLVTSVIARAERSRILRAVFQRMKSGEERFASITRTANEAIVSTNDLGLILSWNDSAKRIFGYRSREILGKPVSILVPEAYRQRHNDGFEQASKGKETKIIGKTIEVEGLRKDGSQFPLDLSLSSWESGGKLFFAATMRDITDRKESETALTYAKEAADNANKAKSEFLSSMSHELRTPMNAILGFGQMLDYNPKEPLTETQKSSVSHILKGGNHLLTLINDILDLAKIEAGKVDITIEDIPLSGIIDECISLIGEMAAARNINIISCDPGDGDKVVLADYTRCKQVFLNLMSNAVKYNNEDGSITIRCEEVTNGMMRLSVVDTGPGIPSNMQCELFKPFSRLGAENSEIEGTGIGLVVCRDLMELMNGAIGFESEEGKGSTFWFELPISGTSSVKDEITLETDTSSNGKLQAMVGTMLYVEDNPANLQLMEMIVSRIDGLEMLSAHTAELGIEIAKSKRPDVIILDINLPGMSGIDAIGKLREMDETKDIPTIALSAAATRNDIEKGMAAGFRQYLTKPIQVLEVTQAINDALKSISPQT